MTLPELSYDLLDNLRRAEIIDDDSIDHRLLWNWIHTNRAFAIRQELSKGYWLNENLLQDCIGTFTVVSSNLESIPETTNIVRSTNQLPYIIAETHKEAVLEVRGLDILTNQYTLVPWNRFQTAGSQRCSKNTSYVALRDHYLYFKKVNQNMANVVPLKFVFRAIFQDPTKVPDYNVITSNYPFNRNIYSYLKDKILKAEANVLLSLKSDEVNNSNSDN